MNWWQKLKKNPLAGIGAILLLVFYLTAIAADFVAPYDPYASQPQGSLLPPTQIYWHNQAGNIIGPHVYPTILGATDINTGDRQLTFDRQKPSPISLFVPGSTYHLLQIRLPLPKWQLVNQPQAEKSAAGAKKIYQMKWEEAEIFPGIPANLHLFGTRGEGKINILGTDEQGRDQFSRLVHGSRIHTLENQQ